MWVYDFFRQSDLPPDELWEPLADITNWCQIDNAIEFVRINQQPNVGVVFQLKRAGGRLHSKKIETFFPPSRFSDISHLPLARMRTTYSLFRMARGTNINIRIEIFGPLSMMWGPIVGRRYANGLFDFTAQLILNASKNQHRSKVPAPHLTGESKAKIDQPLTGNA